MQLIDFYPQIRTIHITLVLVSGALFAARGVGVLAGSAWSLAPIARRLSYAIDTGLLGAALLLLYVLHLNPFIEPWLRTKIVLLLVYIVLGSLALKRARSPRARAIFFAASLLCFGFMLSVAHAHHPLGLFAFG